MVILAACAREKPGVEESVASQPTAARPAAPAPAPAPAVLRGPAFRVAKQTGATRVERAPLGMRLVVPADSELSLDLVNGARVQLEPGSRGWLLDAEPATIVLESGALYAQLPPQGSAAGRPALRVVTAGYALSLAVNGELWLTRPAAASGEPAAPPQSVAVLAGTVGLEHWASAADSPMTTRQLVAGQAFGGATPPAAIPTNGPRTVAEARTAATRLRPVSKAGPAEADVEPRLTRALDAWSDAERRGRTWLEAQRSAKSKGDSAAVQAHQTKLVALAQEKLAIRERVRLAYELACERALGQFDDGSGDLAAFEARYAARVAPAMPSG